MHPDFHEGGGTNEGVGRFATAFTADALMSAAHSMDLERISREILPAVNIQNGAHFAPHGNEQQLSDSEDPRTPQGKLSAEANSSTPHLKSATLSARRDKDRPGKRIFGIRRRARQLFSSPEDKSFWPASILLARNYIVHDKSASQSTDPHVVPGLNALHSDRMEMTSRPVESKRDLSHNGHVDDKKIRSNNSSGDTNIEEPMAIVSKIENGEFGESSGASEARRSPPNSPVVYHVRRALAANLRNSEDHLLLDTEDAKDTAGETSPLRRATWGASKQSYLLSRSPSSGRDTPSTLIRAFFRQRSSSDEQDGERSDMGPEDNGRSQTIRLRELNADRKIVDPPLKLKMLSTIYSESQSFGEEYMEPSERDNRGSMPTDVKLLNEAQTCSTPPQAASSNTSQVVAETQPSPRRSSFASFLTPSFTRDLRRHSSAPFSSTQNETIMDSPHALPYRSRVSRSWHSCMGSFPNARLEHFRRNHLAGMRREEEAREAQATLRREERVSEEAQKKSEREHLDSVSSAETSRPDGNDGALSVAIVPFASLASDITQTEKNKCPESFANYEKDLELPSKLAMTDIPSCRRYTHSPASKNSGINAENEQHGIDEAEETTFATQIDVKRRRSLPLIHFERSVDEATKGEISSFPIRMFTERLKSPITGAPNSAPAGCTASDGSLYRRASFVSEPSHDPQKLFIAQRRSHSVANMDPSVVEARSLSYSTLRRRHQFFDSTVSSGLQAEQAALLLPKRNGKRAAALSWMLFPDEAETKADGSSTSKALPPRRRAIKKGGSLGEMSDFLRLRGVSSTEN